MSTPGASSSSISAATVAAAAPKSERLYIGNLAHTVDEHTIIHVFSKFGQIVKLDFMFHKTGPLKGKPRGFAFIEYKNHEDALKALVKLHDKLLRGRKLVVTHANSAPVADPISGGIYRRPSDMPKATTLSLLKNQQKKRGPQTPEQQIAAMEAKLATMAKNRPAGAGPEPLASVSPAVSASASPAPDLEMEEPLGEKRGREEAQVLEDEIRAAVAAKATASGSGLPMKPSFL